MPKSRCRLSLERSLAGVAAFLLASCGGGGSSGEAVVHVSQSYQLTGTAQISISALHSSDDACALLQADPSLASFDTSSLPSSVAVNKLSGTHLLNTSYYLGDASAKSSAQFATVARASPQCSCSLQSEVVHLAGWQCSMTLDVNVLSFDSETGLLAAPDSFIEMSASTPAAQLVLPVTGTLPGSTYYVQYTRGGAENQNCTFGCIQFFTYQRTP
jgi:hypothetical protein